MTKLFNDPADYYAGMPQSTDLSEEFTQLKKKHTWAQACVEMITNNSYFFSGGTLYYMENGILRCYDGDWEESAMTDRERAEYDWFKARPKKLNKKDTND